MDFKLEEIVDLEKVGAGGYISSCFVNMKPERILRSSSFIGDALVIIDPQNDFIAHNGSLSIKGAIDDTQRLIKHIYNNIYQYDNISVTLDTHYKKSIFFPMAWGYYADEDITFRTIKPEDIYSGIHILPRGKVIPIMERAEQQVKYVKDITNMGKELKIWPYHCIIGTWGHAIENQLSNMLNFYEDFRQIEIARITKGMGIYSEHYGALKPEVNVDGNASIPDYIILWLEELKKFNKINICGQARDYCVYETVKQMCEYYKEHANKINVIYNLSSCIGNIDECYDKYQELVDKYSINLCDAEEDGSLSHYQMEGK